MLSHSAFGNRALRRKLSGIGHGWTRMPRIATNLIIFLLLSFQEINSQEILSIKSCESCKSCPPFCNGMRDGFPFREIHLRLSGKDDGGLLMLSRAYSRSCAGIPCARRCLRRLRCLSARSRPPRPGCHALARFGRRSPGRGWRWRSRCARLRERF